jgi:Na+/H+ antiporter NhaD/arsenite permease-like protein
VAFFPFDFRLIYIALASAAPILLFSRRRGEILRKVDWYTLIFFASMFVLMRSVWLTGFFQSLVENSGFNLLSIETILLVGVVLSQFISNVPLVALYLPLLLQAGAGTRELAALAAGSTIAGNLTILGAASNVIIIQNAERRTGESLTFFDFVKIGAPLTLLNVVVYWAFLSI